MSSPPIAPNAGAIDSDWMTRALRAAGAIGDSRVVDVAAKPVGNGLVGDSFRFTLTYDQAEPNAPATVVGKFAAADPSSRASGAGHRLYLREVTFYKEVAPTVGMFTPRPFYAAIDEATDDFTLIFEDLAPARQGDQLEGCSIADARTAMLEAAALHAPRWNDPKLVETPWLNFGQDLLPQLAPVIPGVVAAFLERYDGRLSAQHLALVERLPDVMPAVWGVRDGPFTVQHGDFRLDNILFDVMGGAHRMGTLDWQTLALGVGVTDATYFLSAGLSPELRRAHERDLIRTYHDELVRLGVRDYGFDQCWRDYRRTAVHGVLMGVFSAMAVERTERGDALFLKMTRGGCLQALDHGTFDLWEQA